MADFTYSLLDKTRKDLKKYRQPIGRFRFVLPQSLPKSTAEQKYVSVFKNRSFCYAMPQHNGTNDTLSYLRFDTSTQNFSKAQIIVSNLIKGAAEVSALNTILYKDCISGMKRLPDSSIDLVIADPPFGIEFKGTESLYRRDSSEVIEGYKENTETISDYYDFTKQWLTEVKRLLQKNGSAYIVSGWSQLTAVLRVIDELDFEVINHIIWKYQFGVFTRHKFSTSHYHILYITHQKSNRIFNRINHYEEDVWEIPRVFEPGSKKNGTKLPIALVAKMIQYSTNPGDVVLDPFMGNGTTAIAAFKMLRHFVGFEFNTKMAEHHLKMLQREQSGNAYIDRARLAELLRLGVDVSWYIPKNVTVAKCENAKGKKTVIENPLSLDTDLSDAVTKAIVAENSSIFNHLIQIFELLLNNPYLFNPFSELDQKFTKNDSHSLYVERMKTIDEVSKLHPRLMEYPKLEKYKLHLQSWCKWSPLQTKVDIDVVPTYFLDASIEKSELIKDKLSLLEKKLECQSFIFVRVVNLSTHRHDNRVYIILGCHRFNCIIEVSKQKRKCLEEIFCWSHIVPLLSETWQQLALLGAFPNSCAFHSKKSDYEKSQIELLKIDDQLERQITYQYSLQRSRRNTRSIIFEGKDLPCAFRYVDPVIKAFQYVMKKDPIQPREV